jgi:hypothetical protein
LVPARGREAQQGDAVTKRPPVKTGDEVDVHSKWRHRIVWRRGEVGRIKRMTRRRERRTGKQETRETEDR